MNYLHFSLTWHKLGPHHRFYRYTLFLKKDDLSSFISNTVMPLFQIFFGEI